MTRDDPAAFAPPPAFGPFRVLHQIGIGALGPVLRTYEPTRDRLVAVKVFRLDVTPEQSALLAAELAVAADAGLFHPSIVEPIAAGVEGTVAYRAEEYVAAESLDVAIRHYAPASLEKALPFLTQLAGAIDFARTAGVGHGALHLRDVFVTPDEARASGFGIVEALERVGIRAPVRRPYSAPERIAGDPWSTPADVFSLAAIAFELLTARRPSGTGDRIGAFPDGILGTYAAAIHGVLARAMADDPARRHPSALAFASALEAAARGGHVSEAVLAIGAINAATAAPAADTAVAAAEAYSGPAGPHPESAAAHAEAPGPVAMSANAVSGARADVGRGAGPELPPGPLNPRTRRRRRSAGAASKLDTGHQLVSDTSARIVPDAQPDAEPAIALGPADQLPPFLRPSAEQSSSEAAVVPPPASAEATAVRSSLVEGSSGAKPEAGPGAVSDADRSSAAGSALDPRDTQGIEAAKADEIGAAQDAGSGADAETGIDADAGHAFEEHGVAAEPAADAEPAVEDHDVAVERDSDAAHYELLRREVEDLPQPMLFDDDEGVADLALHMRHRPRDFSLSELDREDWGQAEADDRTPGSQADLAMAFPVWDADASPIGGDDDRVPAYGSRASEAGEDAQSMIPERPRPAMLPLAVTLVFGLLVGFAAGYAVGDRGQALGAPAAAKPASGVPTPTPPAPSGRPQDGGKAFSEQAVVPPPAAPPPVPGDAPAPAAARGSAAVPAARPAATAGRIIVTSIPPGAGVVVNGKWRGRSPLTLDALKFGEYSVRVVQPGLTAARQDVTLTAAEPSHSIAFRLERGGAAPAPVAPPPAAPAAAAPGARASAGSIYVDSRPRGAHVMIDGRAAGTTPARVPDLVAGPHVVKLELDDHRPWTATTRVAAGRESRVTGSLERIR